MCKNTKAHCLTLHTYFVKTRYDFILPTDISFVNTLT